MHSKGLFSRTCVPTGMNAGVSNVPWGKVNVPALALPHCATSWAEKRDSKS